MICDTLNCAIANDLDRLSRLFQLFLSEKCNLLLWYLVQSPNDLMKDNIADDLEQSLKVTSGTMNDFIAFFTTTEYIMYAVNFNSLKSYISNNFHCFIRAGLLYDAEHDPLAVAKFFVQPETSLKCAKYFSLQTQVVILANRILYKNISTVNIGY